MWSQQGYFFQGWPGQQLANAATPSAQQQSNPSDWAAKAQQWAQQRQQVTNQYYQQQQQPQQVAQWPYQQQAYHNMPQQQAYTSPQQQQQALTAQQQQAHVMQQQPSHVTLQQPGHVTQQQPGYVTQQQQALTAEHQQQALTPQQQQQALAVQQQQHYHQATLHQQPQVQQQQQHQQAYGVGTVQQQSHVQQQQPSSIQQQSHLHQQQTPHRQQAQLGGMAVASSLGVQSVQQSCPVLAQPTGGQGGVVGGWNQLTARLQAEHQSTTAISGSSSAVAKPEPLFPQRSAPSTSSQASSLISHAYQPHPSQSQQQYGGSTLQQTSSLLSDSPHSSTNVSRSPQSGSTAVGNLLGRSPTMVQPRPLLESSQTNVRPKSPASVPPSVESRRYSPMMGNTRPPFRPQGGEGRERDFRFQERSVGMSGSPGPRPPLERSQERTNFSAWERGPPQSRGDISTGPRPPTEEMFSKQEEEQFEYHQQKDQHIEEHSVSIRQEAEYQWQNSEEERRSELEAPNFQRSAHEEEEAWSLYGHEQNGASQHLEGDKGIIRGPSPYGQQQFPYGERSDRPGTITSSPSISISSLKSDEPTISSLRKDAVTAIPGLGGGFEDQEKDVPKPAEPAPGSTQQVSGGGGASGTGTSGGSGGAQANQMIKSLGKIVSQLQTLKGLTSSLQLLQTLPKGGGEEPKGVEPVKAKESSEAELSEETKRKVAALLATESDSDGEQGADDVHRGGQEESRPRHGNYPPPAHETDAREFDGTFDVKPQVYGTYGNENDYPPGAPQQYARDGQRGYQPVDYRDHPDHHARYQPPARMEREGYHPPPRDYYPREDYEQGYRREYPPPRGREPPPSERGYDYRHGPPTAPLYDRERDYDQGPPPPHRLEGMYEPPPQEKDYPPPPQYRGRSPPPPSLGGRYEQQTREREGADPYYDAPSGRELGRHSRVSMDVDRQEHPADNGATDKIGISSKLQSFDYSHGSAYSNYKTVDYNHGPSSDSPSLPPPSAYRDPAYAGSYDQPGYAREGAYPYEGYRYPPGGGGYPPSAGGPFLPSGLDAATLFAAYASQAGESKRKALPSWLREELEKMERKRRKEMEKEALEKARLEEEREQRAAWRDEVDSGEEEDHRKERSGRRERWDGRETERGREGDRGHGHTDRDSRHRNIRPRRTSTSRSRSPHRVGSQSPPPAKRLREEPEEDEEDKQMAMIMKIRKMLTEILLEVTNQEVEDVVVEAIEDEKNPKMKFTMKPVSRPLHGSSARSVLAGLSTYDSDVSDTELDPTPTKFGPALDPSVVAEAFKDTKPSSSGGSGKEKESRHGSSSGHRGSGSTSGKHSSGSGLSKKEKSSSSKSEKSSSSKSSSKKSSSSSKKDSDEHRSSSSSKHSSKSVDKSSSSSKNSSSKGGGSKKSTTSSSDKESKSKSSSDKDGKSKSGSDKDSKSKSKHGSSSSLSKSQSKRSPSPHRRSSSSSKQKDTAENSSKSSSKSSSSKSSESKSSRWPSSTGPSPSSSSGRKHSRHRSSRSRSRSPGRGTSSIGDKRALPSSLQESPQRSTPGSYRRIQIRD